VNSNAIKPYKNVKNDLYVCNDVIMRGDRIVVYTKVTSTFQRDAHESHKGMTHTKQRLHKLHW